MSRNPDDLKFDGTNDKNFLKVKLDVTKEDSIAAAFKETLSKFKRVHVVVNNAGYGLCGSFKEVDREQGRMQMDINFYGLAKVTKKALEVMREQKPSDGLTQQVTSVGGQIGVPTFRIIVRASGRLKDLQRLYKELKPEWNIKLTYIEPGGFRPAWSGGSMKFPEKRHPAYDHIDAKKNAEKRNGTQPGDPKKGAQGMYKFATMENPPLLVCIGTDGYAGIMNKLKVYGENYSKYKEISNSTDVDEYEPPEEKYHI